MMHTEIRIASMEVINRAGSEPISGPLSTRQMRIDSLIGSEDKIANFDIGRCPRTGRDQGGILLICQIRSVGGILNCTVTTTEWDGYPIHDAARRPTINE